MLEMMLMDSWWSYCFLAGRDDILCLLLGVAVEPWQSPGWSRQKVLGNQLFLQVRKLRLRVHLSTLTAFLAILSWACVFG